MFCNQCGKEVDELEQYCMNCGGYLKKEEGMQTQENQFKYCKQCGAEVSGRYCEACGTSGTQITAKLNNTSLMKQIKQASTGIKQSVPTKPIEPLKINIQSISKKEMIEWTKSGLIFSGIAVVASLIMSLVLGYVIKLIYWEDKLPYSDDLDGLIKNVYNTFFNFKIWGCNLLFGGQIEWNMTIGNVAKGRMLLSLPFLGIVLGILILYISEKIRYKITHDERTWQENIIMSVICGIVFSLTSLVLTKSVRLSSSDLYYLGYGSIADYDIAKITTSVNVLSTFWNVSLMAFCTLTFIIRTEALRQNRMVKLIRKVTSLLLGFSIMIALGAIIRIIIHNGEMPEAKEIILYLGILAYLVGFILSCMLTGQFRIFKVIINSESVLNLKMNLSKIGYEYYGMADKQENVLKIWVILLMLIAIVTLLVMAYHYWQEQKCTLKQGAIEAGWISLGLGLAFALITKASQLFLSIEIKVTDEYKYAFGVDQNKNLYKMLSGNTSIIKTVIVIGIISFIAFMLMYGLWSLQHDSIHLVMNYITVKALFIVMIIFSILFTVKLDFYSFNDASLNLIKNAQYEITDGLSDIMDGFIR